MLNNHYILYCIAKSLPVIQEFKYPVVFTSMSKCKSIIYCI